MPVTSEAIKQDLDQLTTNQLQQVADFIAFLKFRDQRRRIVLDPVQLASLATEFAEEDPGITVWTAYAGHGINGTMVWFCHFEDHITVKNPDEATLVKMHQIASALGAKVQGDDGEEYNSDGQSERLETSSPGADRKLWWKFWEQ